MRKDFINTCGFKTRKDGTVYIGRVPAELDSTEIADLIAKAEEIGYTAECIMEGVLGYGKTILWAPEGYKNMIIREVPKTCWTSAHTVERFIEIYPELQAEIDECLNAMLDALEG